MDRESVLVGRVVPGRPVDPPDEPRPFAPRSGKHRPPVIPPALASRAAVAATLAWAAREARYHAGFHAVRAPKYAVKTAVYAVPGALRTIGAAGPVGQRGGRQLAPAPGRRRQRTTPRPGWRSMPAASARPAGAGPS